LSKKWKNEDGRKEEGGRRTEEMEHRSDQWVDILMQVKVVILR
jgi:hypothetical protein